MWEGEPPRGTRDRDGRTREGEKESRLVERRDRWVYRRSSEHPNVREVKSSFITDSEDKESDLRFDRPLPWVTVTNLVIGEDEIH